MAKWLTQEWLDEDRRLAESQPERPGASTRMQYVVTGGPDGDVKFFWTLVTRKRVEDGGAVLRHAEVTLNTDCHDAVIVLQVELVFSAGFMQVGVKVTGIMPKVMDLFPTTNSPSYKQFQQ